MSERYSECWNGTHYQIYRDGHAIAEDAVADLNRMDAEIERIGNRLDGAGKLIGEQRAEIERLKTALAACGRLCAEVQDWADRLADGDDLTLDECQEYSARCARIAQAWMPEPTPEELKMLDAEIKKLRDAKGEEHD